MTCYQGGVAIRTAPSVEAPCVGEVLQWNEVVSERPRNICRERWGEVEADGLPKHKTTHKMYAEWSLWLLCRSKTTWGHSYCTAGSGGLPLVCCHRRSVAGTMPLSSSRMSYVYGISYGVRQQACQRARAASCALGHGSRVLVLNMTPDAYRRLQRLILPRFSHVHTVATP